ncbi:MULTISPECIES: arylsulfotransferase family protein [unclassified Ruegeria]|uniref:arylsulfotransferase family protein n=1 Tax=unclassified Ruegeria TaxID=2625375 RepID=UPI00148829F0|nr:MULTISPECIES: arylsulfotransferase family protein [unclassified Ruegeria]
MEKLLFKKIEAWVLVLVFLGFGLVLIGFGTVLRNHMNGHDKYGALGELAFGIANLPSNARDVFQSINHDRMSTIWGEAPRFHGQDGWVVRDENLVSDLTGYILLSRYDGVSRHHRVELVALPEFEIVHEWPIDAELVFADQEVHPFHDQSEAIDNEIFRSIHPLVLPNGALIVKDHYTSLLQIDQCGQRTAFTTGGFHHSTELGPKGLVWVPGTRLPTEIARVRSDFRDDTIVALNQEGEVVLERSVPNILLKNGLGHLLFSMSGSYDPDPLHLNDIQPVYESGPHWKEGDLFLSMRHKSLVLLYRPSTDEVLWYKTGPWRFQHDVDILDENRIAIYDNSTINIRALPQVDGANSIMIFDFEKGVVEDLLRKDFERAEIRTISEGLFDRMDDGSWMVEEENFGRLVILSPTGEIAAEYFNGDGGLNTYRMGWSRYVSESDGVRIVIELAKKDCLQH